MKTLQLDLTKLYYNKKIFNDSEDKFSDKPELKTAAFLEETQAYKKVLTELTVPSKYDLILCNPPWIPASKVVDVNPLDNGVYDPDEVFLKSALNFARLHLSPEGKGKMLLVYSDLAQIIGLQKPDRIEELCHRAGLYIEEVYEITMAPSKKPYDPLVNYKAEASVQLFEIFKQ